MTNKKIYNENDLVFVWNNSSKSDMKIRYFYSWFTDLTEQIDSVIKNKFKVRNVFGEFEDYKYAITLCDAVNQRKLARKIISVDDYTALYEKNTDNTFTF